MNIFEKIKAKVRAEDVADHLLGKPIRGMYRYPGERTASIKIYPKTRSFFDFGRACGGDVFELWMHVRHCDLAEALRSIKDLYHILDAESVPDWLWIEQQKKARAIKRQEQERKKQLWRAEVERLHEQIRVCENLLGSEHIPPLSDVWCFCIEQKQLAEHKLDVFCGICGWGR